MLRYARTVIGYHGCDESTVERLLRGEPFRPSTNAYDWLGSGVYFWEYGPDRALSFAEEQRRRGKLKRPAVVGAVLQLGRCFDLLDTRFTEDLADAHREFAAQARAQGLPLPVNRGRTPDRELRYLDCTVLNWYLLRMIARGTPYDSVRCAFLEGEPVYEGAGIYKKTHIQISICNPTCIVGTFIPTLEVTPPLLFEDAA
ncbi:hypothetical protein [Hyalangium rubrum]|uniref:Uncharacterized protein n=1 Tax=Hyalangium rubrum TaxID=3103134 RepID=A0ABU5HAI1_9BACT|nr:hypothetical protein [Hyalangium sp. s54d21]MDY7230122.1 hypothetical protein [Hyalangium sp. s54d21]